MLTSRLRTFGSRLGLAAAVVSFGGYFVLTSQGDLFPLEQFGAEFVTSSQIAGVTSIVPGGPADRAGIRAGDQVLTVDGRQVRNALDWATVFARVDEGRPVPVTVRRGDRVEQREVVFRARPGGPWGTPESTVVVMTRFAQLVTLIFAIALAVRASGHVALLGFWLLATISIYSVGLPPRMAVVWRAMPLPVEILFYLPSISKVLIGFILFVFFRALVNAPLSGRRVAAYALPFVAFVVWDAVFLTALLHFPRLLPGLTGFLPLVIAVNFAYVVGAVVMLIVHYRTLRDPSDRRRLRWVVASSILGCAAGAPTVAGLWLSVGDDPTLIYHSPLALQLAYTAFLVMPVSFWWAIARGQLFDFGFVVRRGIQYVFARRGLLVITPIVMIALLLEAALHEDESLRQILRAHGFAYAGVAAALTVFRSRRASWLDALDRRLFRERYDACQLLRDVAAQIRTARDLKTAANSAVKEIDAALHPESLTVYSGRATDEAFDLLAGQGLDAGWRGQSRLMQEIRKNNKPLDVGTHSKSRLALSLPGDETEFLKRARVRLLVPGVVGAESPEVVFALGKKRSGEPYSQEDKNLVQAVAESVAQLASTLPSASADVDRDSPDRPASWDRRLWSLADAVARGTHVDWTKESTGIITEERRQVLLELQALERLMQVHGAPANGSTNGAKTAERFSRWGEFDLREQIGAGRFGSVYRAWDPKLEREVAIKLLTVASVDRAAYLREARHLARVRHPNVVHVYGADEIDDVPGFWMELIEGKTLGQLFQERGPFNAEDAAAVGTSLCRALGAVHRSGLVHQDVKTQNVVQDDDGRLVLMDLGAVTADAGRPQSGTPCYMAPELFNGGVASARSDLYSLGVLLFFLTTGEFPVDGRSYDEIAERLKRGDRRQLRQLRPDFPSGFLSAIDRVLATDPSDRFGSADDLGAAFRSEVV